MFTFLALCLSAPPPVKTLPPGEHKRTLTVGGLKRSYIVHVPKKLDATKPAPIVLALHGASMNAKMMVNFSGLSKKAEQAGFIAVYPNGTGLLQTWNAGAMWGGRSRNKVDDVAFIGKVLDDLAGVVRMDPKRIYVTGMSNGGMMCYRLAAELSHRIAAIAPVAGTLCLDKVKPKRPMPLLHIHGTKDSLVPFDGPKRKGSGGFKSVDDSVMAWVKINGCALKPTVSDVPAREKDGTKVKKKVYKAGKAGAEVVLYIVEGGGHVWPGMDFPLKLFKSVKSLSANDVIWEFFSKQRLK